MSFPWTAYNIAFERSPICSSAYLSIWALNTFVSKPGYLPAPTMGIFEDFFHNNNLLSRGQVLFSINKKYLPEHPGRFLFPKVKVDSRPQKFLPTSKGISYFNTLKACSRSAPSKNCKNSRATSFLNTGEIDHILCHKMAVNKRRFQGNGYGWI